MKRSANAAVLTFLEVLFGRGVGEVVRGNHGIQGFGSAVRDGRGLCKTDLELPGLFAVIIIWFVDGSLDTSTHTLLMHSLRALSLDPKVRLRRRMSASNFRIAHSKNHIIYIEREILISV